MIHTLYGRLNWERDGILEGRPPVEEEEKTKTYSISTRKEDDGEFVYCLPRCYIEGEVRF